MAGSLPVVSIFGVKNVKLRSGGPIPNFETEEMDCRCYLSDQDLAKVLARDRPNVVVTFGNAEDFPNVSASAFDIRRRWLHFENTDDLDYAGRETFQCFKNNALMRRDEVPLVTVFTPAYKTGEKIRRPFRSLQEQTYKDWEWIIIDDSDDDGETFEILQDLMAEDRRVTAYRHKHTGKIGELKHQLCMLARGSFLVELDHDDELTDVALEGVVKGFQQYPEAGFVYTDFAEAFEKSYEAVEYGQGWGHGYGSYRQETYKGRKFSVVNAPNINPKTIRHIVAAPNHIRAWRKSFYDSIGGHGRDVHVADDYELLVRTFLHTRMVRVPVFSYIQYRNQEGNTHRTRNTEIQRLVRTFSQFYDQRIHERFIELGVNDFVWQEGISTFWEMNKIINPPEEPHCTLLAKV